MTPFQPSPQPDTTPWDAPDRADQVLPGIWRVWTPSHGGYVLSDERQAAMPDALRRDDPFYEEDVDYALVLYAFGSEFRRLPIPGIALQVEVLVFGRDASIADQHVRIVAEQGISDN